MREAKQRQRGFEGGVKALAETQGYQALWTEEVHPAGQWIARHPKDRHAVELARAVHQNHPVAFGTLRAVGQGVEVPQPESYLMIQEIENVEPLDQQFGVEQPKWVPDALLEPLFGQPAPTEAEIELYGSAAAVPPMRTYAILDAAKMPYTLTSQLAASELRHQSLFQGASEEELKEVAPYLVELEDANRFTTKLFTGPKGVNGLWDKELGIYVRSRAPFDKVRKHFRKFTRMQDENGKWYYFRFWEGSALVPYFEGFEKSESKSNGWFPMLISMLCVVSNTSTAVLISRVGSIPGSKISGPILLSNDDKNALNEGRNRIFVTRLVQYMSEIVPGFGDLEAQKQRNILKNIINGARKWNIDVEQAVALFVEASLRFGKPLDSNVELRSILSRKTLSQIEKSEKLLSSVKQGILQS